MRDDIDSFIYNQGFSRRDTKDAVLEFYGYLLNNDIPGSAAKAFLSRLISAMRKELNKED